MVKYHTSRVSNPVWVQSHGWCGSTQRRLESRLWRQFKRAALEALRREFEEETFAAIHHADPVAFATDASNNLVLLLFACRDWTGAPEGREGQTIKWVDSADLEHYEMLPLDEKLVLPLCEFMMGV